MSKKTSQQKLNLAYKLFKDMQQDNLEYTYRGNFSPTITDNILSLAETNLDETKDKLKIRKRVYFIMVEGLQNITRHQEESEDLMSKPGLFVIQRKKNGYYITTGNVIKAESIINLTTQLEKINSLDNEELKTYAREILEAGGFSDKGGAGLGLIEIARKSGTKLSFDFKKLDDNYSYFYLLTEVPFAGTIRKEANDHESSLDSIKDLHNLLDDYNILLNFSGIFNQDNLINLLSIIERQMKGTVILKMKVFNIMVEMLQNILKHADNFNFNNIVGNYGIFFISEKDNEFQLTAGNYIKNSKIPALKSLIEKVNNASLQELNDLYTSALLDESKKVGLGITDMRLKCAKPYDFDFIPVDEFYSFFSLQISVDKSVSFIDPLTIAATPDTPEIILDVEKEIFKISGRAIPEDAHAFFKPIIEWLEKYQTNPASRTVFKVRLDYFNTSSDKQIARIFKLLESIALKSEVTIKWYYKSEDKDHLSAGLRYSKLVNLKFDMVIID